MSQPSIAAYFASRKRRANDVLGTKSKVRIHVDQDDKPEVRELPSDNVIDEKNVIVDDGKTKTEKKKELVARNLLSELSSKPSRTRKIKSQTSSDIKDDQQKTIESMFKLKEPGDNPCLFAKLGNLSPKKSVRQTRASKSSKSRQKNAVQVPEKAQASEEKLPVPNLYNTPTKEPAIFQTPKKNFRKELTFEEIKEKVTTSARLQELRARIAQFQNCEKKLEKLEQAHKEKKEEIKNNAKRLKIKEFDRLEIEIPVSPHKALLSPNKLLSPEKTISHLSPKASPVRRLLFEPKEEPFSPVKASPTKGAAYQRYQSLAAGEDAELHLPYKYRFIFEIFRSIDTVTAMLYNRCEVITFKKLQPAVQELVRRNFTLDTLAQIKTIWPEAFSFRQEKICGFSSMKVAKYELVITPNIFKREESGQSTSNEDDVIKSATKTQMGPHVLLERRRKFRHLLLERVKDEHDKFLKALEVPLIVPKDKITRWHPEFDLENCKDIEKAEIPKEPIQEKAYSAKNMLIAANKMINNSTRMHKAIELLAKNKTEVTFTADETKFADDTTITEEATTVLFSTPKLNSSVIDTPPATPETPTPFINPALRGIPKSILDKVRAKQAAKALEMMTRSTNGHKEAAMHARLPDMAKIIRNIFVTQKKNVLMLEQVVQKLDDSYRTKLTVIELEEHIKLLCKLLPLWIMLIIIKNVNYLKLSKDYDMGKVINRLEILAQEKV